MNEKLWLVKWKLLGKPRQIPVDMLRCVPAQAFDLVDPYRGESVFYSVYDQGVWAVRATGVCSGEYSAWRKLVASDTDRDLRWGTGWTFVGPTSFLLCGNTESTTGKLIRGASLDTVLGWLIADLAKLALIRDIVQRALQGG